MLHFVQHSIIKQFIYLEGTTINCLYYIGTNQNTGVTEGLHSQRRDQIDEAEIKSQIWSSKSPSKIDWGIEEGQKLFDRWRNESRWRIAETFSVVVFICNHCPYVILKFNIWENISG